MRVELPLPREDKGDEIVWLGLHGQAVDWRGGISERLRKDESRRSNMLSGYGFQYLGLLDKDADGMGLWTATEDMTVVAHPSDTTMQFFVNLLRGEYGKRVVNDQAHFSRSQWVLVRKRRESWTTVAVPTAQRSERVFNERLVGESVLLSTYQIRRRHRRHFSSKISQAKDAIRQPEAFTY